MKFCHLTMQYCDEYHAIPLEAEIEANWKLQEYNSQQFLGSYLYASGLLSEAKEKYKRDKIGS